MKFTMRLLLVIIATISVAVVSGDVLTNNTYDDPTYDEAWSWYKEAYNKSYTNATIENECRQMWFSTMDMVINHNQLAEQGQFKYMLGVNKYSDLDPSMLKTQRNRLFLTQSELLQINAFVYLRNLKNTRKKRSVIATSYLTTDSPTTVLSVVTNTTATISMFTTTTTPKSTTKAINTTKTTTTTRPTTRTTTKTTTKTTTTTRPKTTTTT